MRDYLPMQKQPQQQSPKSEAARNPSPILSNNNASTSKHAATANTSPPIKSLPSSKHETEISEIPSKNPLYLKSNGPHVRRRNFLGDEHTAPLREWRRLRVAVVLLLSSRARSGKPCRAGLGRARYTSGKARRVVLKEKDRVNLKGCLCGALDVGLKAHNQD
ncbi:hypothetical protein ACFX1Z_039933 [Malus domestica]